MLKVRIKTKNILIEYNGTSVRTPANVYISDKDRLFFESYLKTLGVREYKIMAIKKPKNKLDKPIKVSLTSTSTKRSSKSDKK